MPPPRNTSAISARSPSPLLVGLAGREGLFRRADGLGRLGPPHVRPSRPRSLRHHRNRDLQQHALDVLLPHHDRAGETSRAVATDRAAPGRLVADVAAAAVLTDRADMSDVAPRRDPTDGIRHPEQAGRIRPAARRPAAAERRPADPRRVRAPLRRDAAPQEGRADRRSRLHAVTRSPARHGKPHVDIIAWLGSYAAATPGAAGGDNSTLRLDLDNEPQPDAFCSSTARLRRPGRIARTTMSKAAPELVVEVAASSVSYDLHAKLNAYRRNGVREYVVWRVLDRQSTGSSSATAPTNDCRPAPTAFSQRGVPRPVAGRRGDARGEHAQGAPGRAAGAGGTRAAGAVADRREMGCRHDHRRPAQRSSPVQVKSAAPPRRRRWVRRLLLYPACIPSSGTAAASLPAPVRLRPEDQRSAAVALAAGVSPGRRADRVRAAVSDRERMKWSA